MTAATGRWGASITFRDERRHKSALYLRGAAPKSIRTGQIYRGVLPFIAIQIAVLALLVIFPDIVTWLPETLDVRTH